MTREHEEEGKHACPSFRRADRTGLSAGARCPHTVHPVQEVPSLLRTQGGPAFCTLGTESRATGPCSLLQSADKGPCPQHLCLLSSASPNAAAKARGGPHRAPLPLPLGTASTSRTPLSWGHSRSHWEERTMLSTFIQAARTTYSKKVSTRQIHLM